MSDIEGSSGTFKDANAAREANTWEARLEAARKKRAHALAQTPQTASSETSPDHVEASELPLPPDEPTMQPPVDGLPASENSPPNRHRKAFGGIAIVIAAMSCGAFLHWAVGKVSGSWQAVGQEMSVDQTSPDDPAPDDQIALSLANPSSLNPDQVAQTFQSRPEREVSSLIASIGPSSELTDETATDLLRENVIEEKKSENLGENTLNPQPTSTPEPAPIPERVATLEPPQVPVIVISRSAPSIFIPVAMNAALPGSAVPSADALAPDPEQSASLTFHSPQLQNSILATNAMYDSDLQNLIALTSPSQSEVKPLPVIRQVNTLDVSLFVPARVSEDASDRALQVLTSGRTNVIATARVGYSVRETQVRFYHPDDAETAEQAATALGGVSRDFTSSYNKTRPGHVEVYLAGRGGGGGQRSSNTQPRNFENFINRLLDELR